MLGEISLAEFIALCALRNISKLDLHYERAINGCLNALGPVAILSFWCSGLQLLERISFRLEASDPGSHLRERAIRACEPLADHALAILEGGSWHVGLLLELVEGKLT